MWHPFTKYLGSIGISNDIFLDSFTRSQRNKIIRAFAVALRQGRFSGPAHSTLASGTIQNTISDISATFPENDQPSPTKDNNLHFSFIYTDNYEPSTMLTPKKRNKKPSPPKKITEMQCVILQLTILAVFFAMHSCKYVRVQLSMRSKEPKYFASKTFDSSTAQLVNHNDPSLEYADCINITFQV